MLRSGVVALLALLATATFAARVLSEDLQIGVKFRPENCEAKAKNGDYVSVHYTGKLTDETVFDSSIERGEPISFELGAGRVIKGWDQGIVGMCVGEKRKLQIPPHLAYGDDGIGPIPAGATLLFDVELTAISEPPAGGGAFPAYDDYPYGGGGIEQDAGDEGSWAGEGAGGWGGEEEAEDLLEADMAARGEGWGDEA